MSTYPPGAPDPAEDETEDADISDASREEFLRWLEQLRQSDRALYNLMAMEVWSIAQTMDTLIPGFWSRFMENRQLALKKFIQHRHDSHADPTHDEDLAQAADLSQPISIDNGKMEGKHSERSPVDSD